VSRLPKCLSVLVVPFLVAGLLAAPPAPKAPKAKAAPAAEAEAALPENPVIERLRAASVMVVLPGGGSGSGFLLVRGDSVFVVTAWHVVDSLRSSREGSDGKPVVEWADCKVVQKGVQDGRIVKEVAYDAQVLKVSEREDLALLRLRERKAFTSGLEFFGSKQIPPVGTRLLHVGAPLGDIGAQSVIPGFYSAHGRLINRQILDQISCAAFPGSSGGAVALEGDGRVVGLVVRGANGGFILIVGSRSVRQWSQRAGIESLLFDPKAPLPSEEDLTDPKKTEDK
jgi:S1-C subfamily serine protease